MDNVMLSARARLRDLKSHNNPHATKGLADALIAVNRETYETPDKKGLMSRAEDLLDSATQIWQCQVR